MPDAAKVLKMAAATIILSLGVIATIVYSDSTSGKSLSINNFNKHSLNHADYMYCILVIIVSLLSLCTLKGKGKVVTILMSFTIFFGFIISGIFAIAVAFEIQCCFDIKLMYFQHFENTDDIYVPVDDGYTGDGLAECKNFDEHGTCNIEHYCIIGGPWLAINVLNCLLSAQISYIEQYAAEVDHAHDEYMAYAERTNLVVEGSDDDDHDSHIELAFQP